MMYTNGQATAAGLSPYNNGYGGYSYTVYCSSCGQCYNLQSFHVCPNNQNIGLLGLLGKLTFTGESPVAITKSTIRVTSGSFTQDFDGDTAMDKAVEAASEQAQKSNETVYIFKVAKVVRPKREVTVEDVGA